MLENKLPEVFVYRRVDKASMNLGFDLDRISRRLEVCVY